MTFSGAITQTTMRTEFDALTANLTSDALLGQELTPFILRVPLLAVAMDVSVRSLDFTMPDDVELSIMRVMVTHTVAGLFVTARLTVTDGDATYLLDQTLATVATSVIGTAHAVLDMRTTTQAKRLRLLRGVRYRLSLTSTGTVDVAQAMLMLKTRRRVR